MRLEDVLLRAARADQPLATDVPEGSLYFVTDENIIEQSFGGVWESYSAPAAPSLVYHVGITIDGSGLVLTTGIKGYRTVPVSGLITKVRIIAKEVGNIQFDIWRDTFANYPPTDADSITAGNEPAIVGANKFEDSTLTGWSLIVTAGEILGFNIDSVTTITRATLELEITT